MLRYQIPIDANVISLRVQVNGDAEMEWEEFTNFIVDTGLAQADEDNSQVINPVRCMGEDVSTSSAARPRLFVQYHRCDLETSHTATKALSLIEKTFYFDAIDNVILFNHSSHAFRAFHGSGVRKEGGKAGGKAGHQHHRIACVALSTQAKSPRPHGSAPQRWYVDSMLRYRWLLEVQDLVRLSAEYISDIGLVATSATDKTLRLWDPHRRYHLVQARSNLPSILTCSSELVRTRSDAVDCV